MTLEITEASLSCSKAESMTTHWVLGYNAIELPHRPFARGRPELQKLGFGWHSITSVIKDNASVVVPTILLVLKCFIEKKNWDFSSSGLHEE